MFTIFSTSKQIKIIKKLLEKEGFKIRETKFPEYIVTTYDPSSFIPKSLKKSFKIMKFSDRYFSILKETNTLKELLEPVSFKKGDPVKIISGNYKDFAGIIIAVQSNNLYKVEIGIWGKIITDVLQAEQLEKSFNIGCAL